MADKSVFVILYPHSNSNPSDQYRVVSTRDLMDYINEAKLSYGYSPFSTYPEALAARDKANG